MNTEVHANAVNGALHETGLTETLSKVEENCRNCQPLSMLECVANCSSWRLKNEFRELHKKMQDPDFTTKLLNVLKNRRRLRILETISKGRYSVGKLQEELKKLGYSHSQKTILEEYLTPLTDVKLTTETQGRYYATLFGSKLSELAKGSSDLLEILPPHSECYEETILVALLDGPKTHEHMRNRIALRNISRALGRLQALGLVETNKEKDHVFLFKTRRSPDKEETSPTEKRVYENIAEEGISARSLAEKVKISLRRTYKYLRRLKGKKMVFSREKPKSFALTVKGSQLVLTLKKIGELTTEASTAATKLIKDDEGYRSITAEICQMEPKKRAKAVISLATEHRARPNLSVSQ
jgi:DNA-binding transcriptional ArsR family regulator/predicted transcriptional regulator